MSSSEIVELGRSLKPTGVSNAFKRPLLTYVDPSFHSRTLHHQVLTRCHRCISLGERRNCCLWIWTGSSNYFGSPAPVVSPHPQRSLTRYFLTSWASKYWKRTCLLVTPMQRGFAQGPESSSGLRPRWWPMNNVP